MSMGCSAPSPRPLVNIRPRNPTVITMLRDQVSDVEGAAHRLLVEGCVDLVGMLLIHCNTLNGLSSLGSNLDLCSTRE